MKRASAVKIPKESGRDGLGVDKKIRSYRNRALGRGRGERSCEISREFGGTWCTAIEHQLDLCRTERGKLGLGSLGSPVSDPSPEGRGL